MHLLILTYGWAAQSARLPRTGDGLPLASNVVYINTITHTKFNILQLGNRSGRFLRLASPRNEVWDQLARLVHSL